MTDIIKPELHGEEGRIDWAYFFILVWIFSLFVILAFVFTTGFIHDEATDQQPQERYLCNKQAGGGDTLYCEKL